MEEKILNDVKQQFCPSKWWDKLNAELVKSLREQIENRQGEICFLREEMKEKTTPKWSFTLRVFHQKWFYLPLFTDSTSVKMLPKRQLSKNKTYQNHHNPSNRGASKDHHTNFIPIPSIKPPTSFAVIYKKDSNIMVERDGSIVCQQSSKEPESKKLIRTIESCIKKTKSYKLNKSNDNKEILNK